jgi:serine/threonine protein kinase
MNQDLITAESLTELEKYDYYTEGMIGTTPKFNEDEVRRVSHLGDGAYGVVYLVITDNRDQLALKSLNLKKLKTSEDFVDAAADLAKEADILSKLNHTNIIHLRGVSDKSLSQSYNVNGAGMGFFILLDTLHETLQTRLQRWRRELPPPPKKKGFAFKKSKDKPSAPTIDQAKMNSRIKLVAVGIAKGMQYLHENDVIMQDLKPENVGFDQNTGEVRIFDFGMIKKLGDKTNTRDEERGMICGTPRYMAPEVMAGKGSVKVSDVFAYGVVLYEICTLQALFSDETSLENFQQRILAGERPSLEDIPDELIRDLISDCWAGETNERPTFEQINSRLAEMTNGVDV